MQLALRSCLFRIGVLRSHIQYKSLRTLLEKQTQVRLIHKLAVFCMLLTVYKSLSSTMVCSMLLPESPLVRVLANLLQAILQSLPNRILMLVVTQLNVRDTVSLGQSCWNLYCRLQPSILKYNIQHQNSNLLHLAARDNDLCWSRALASLRRQCQHLPAWNDSVDESYSTWIDRNSRTSTQS
jgi:hypothetical protein